MPKSKRDKEVTLTKVKRKGKETKLKLVDEIRRCLDSYKNLFVFSYHNMRGNKLAVVRTRFKTDGRFFLGKNKIMALALGRIPQEEHKEGLSRVSKLLTGQRGLLFTNWTVEKVTSYFESLRENDFARSGNVATETVQLDAGPMEQFPFNLEAQLRKLGLPTKLEKGVVTLATDHVVCNVGEKLTPEQAKILQYLDFKMAEFRIELLCVWSRDIDGKDDGSTPTFKKLFKKKLEEGKTKKSKRNGDETIMNEQVMDTD